MLWDPTLLPPPTQCAEFLVAILALAVFPGPGVLYIVTRSLVSGPRLGLVSVAGIATGNLVCALAAGWGVAFLLRQAPSAFIAIRAAGAGYLLFLGFQALKATSPPASGDTPTRGVPQAAGRLFLDGLMVALFNPKTVLFMATVLPAFLPPHPRIAQVGILCLAAVVLAACTDSLYALAAGTLGHRIQAAERSRGLLRFLPAAVFLGLGFAALVSALRLPAP